MKIPLIEKYRPKKFEEIKGQDIIIDEIKHFYRSFPIKKALILNGPTGVGKTSLAIALSKEYNLELFELNASDLRNRKSLDEVLKPSLEQKSLFKKGKLILMDEADGITTKDNGGLAELIFLIEKTNYPIVITVNDVWQRKFNLLRKKCRVINIKELNEESTKKIILNIIDSEKKKINPDILNIILKKSRGDVRAAINDLQSIIDFGEEKLMLDISEREKRENIFNGLKKLFQEETEEKTLNIFDSLDLELDEILLWIEENLPFEYHGTGLLKAIEALSRADIFKGRIYRQQYWRFLIYENFFLSAGVSVATKLKNKKFVDYKRPSRILKIWLSNQKNEKIKSIANKYAALCHMSKKKAIKDRFLLPLILIDNETKSALDLDKKEEEFLDERRNDLIISGGLKSFCSSCP